MTGVLPRESPGIVVLAARRIASETVPGEAEPELAPEAAVSFEDRLVRARARRRVALAARGGEPAPPRPAWLRAPPEALARAIPAAAPEMAPEMAPAPEARGVAPPAGEGGRPGWDAARRVVAAALLGLGAVMTAPRQAGDPAADAGVGAAAGGGAEASAARYAAPAPPEISPPEITPPAVLRPAAPPGALAGRFVIPAAAAPPLVSSLVDPREASLDVPPSSPPSPRVAVTAPAQGRAPAPPAFPAVSGPDRMASSIVAAGAPDPPWIPASGGADGPVPPAAARPPAVPEDPPTTATTTATTAPGTELVFVHVPPGVAPARVARLLGALRAKGYGAAQVIPVGFPVARDNLRFYHAADRARAARIWAEVAPAMAGPRYASPARFHRLRPRAASRHDRVLAGRRVSPGAISSFAPDGCGGRSPPRRGAGRGRRARSAAMSPGCSSASGR